MANTDQNDIGRFFAGGTTYTHYMNGSMDEIRISNVVRELPWIKANYYAQTDALVSWGSEELIPSGRSYGYIF